jgi:hypothetical protein
MMYPCKVNCSDPNQGQLEIHVQPRRNEVVSLKNNAPWPIDLEDYELKSAPYRYSFPNGSVLPPGGTMSVFTKGDPSQDTQFEKHWGMTSEILGNGGDVVSVVGYTDITLGCTAWGTNSC